MQNGNSLSTVLAQAILEKWWKYAQSKEYVLYILWRGNQHTRIHIQHLILDITLLLV